MVPSGTAGEPAGHHPLPRRSRVLWLRRPGDEAVAAVVADQSARELTYREVGATGGQLPARYRHDQWSADLGPFSPGAFETAAQTLRSWRVQTGAGMAVFPGEPVRPDATFALVSRLPFARPRHWAARAGAPVTRMMQLLATRRYLATMRRAVKVPTAKDG
jgi:uncharacterized protein (UPF0548 family)